MSEIKEFQRSVGVTKSEEFNKKQLATHAINGGLICGHGCAYCSTPSLLRTNSLFRNMGISSFQYFKQGNSIVDPWTAIRVGRQISKLCPEDMVMISTITDCWSPEAQKYNLGRKILEQILVNSKCKVRILTKNAAVQNDFDIIKQFGDRIRIGLSITSPTSKENIIKLLEPNASLISERMDALKKAHSLLNHFFTSEKNCRNALNFISAPTISQPAQYLKTNNPICNDDHSMADHLSANSQERQLPSEVSLGEATGTHRPPVFDVKD